MTIRALIVDDEALARQGIREFLEAEEDIEVVGEAESGTQALAQIEDLEPDLIFLDIQMPEMGGFDLLQALDEDRLPAVVFVTAHDRFALEAFEAHALDYLLKPVEQSRFHEAVERVRAQLHYHAAKDGGLASLVRELRTPTPAYRQRLLVKSAGKITFLKTDEINWIEATGNYARLHTAAGLYLIRSSMAKLEDRLDPNQFLRVHRSTIVNLDRVKEIQPWFKGESVVILHDGTSLSLSRKYRERLLTTLGKAL